MFIKDTKDFSSDIKRRVSYKKKVANKFKRQIEIMDAYDYDYHLSAYDDSRIQNYNRNYDLFNGRLDVDLYNDPLCFNVGEESVTLDREKIVHYPLISQVANALHGEIKSRPFRPMAIDNGPSGNTFREKKLNELLRKITQQEIIAPLRQKIEMDYFNQNGVQDIFKLTPEEQQQAVADIQRRTQKMTPEDVFDFMANEFQTPNQRVVQRLIDHLGAALHIKDKSDENAIHAICTGEEIYYVGDRHGFPVFDVVNPKYFTAGGSQNTEWYQDMTWCKYEQWFTVGDVMQRHAEHFSENNLRDLEKVIEPIGGLAGVGDPRYDKTQERTMIELSDEGTKIYQNYKDVNYKTKEGSKTFQRIYQDVIAKYGERHGYNLNNYGVREAHICWRDKRKLKKVYRVENDRMVSFWQDEHYEPQPVDVKVMNVWVDEVWEGTKVGSTIGNEFYLNIRPIPGQYKSIYNPFGTDLPYYGKSYNTHMNNSKNVSVIDLGKSWQMEFDITMANIKHDLSTDLGHVLLAPLSLKPDNWKWQQWFDTLKNGKVAIAQLQKYGMSYDPNLLRGINLSKTADIANKIQLLDFNFRNLVRAMNFNDARMGAVGQYTTNENIIQSQSASYNQTEGFFDTHRQILEKAVNALVNRARIMYKNTPESQYIYDDISRILADVSPDFWYEAWNVRVSTNSSDIRKMEEMRQQIQAFIQNGMSFDGILALIMADTPGDVVDIVKKETKRREQERQQAMAMQQQQAQAEMQTELQKEQMKAQNKEKLEMAKLASHERRSELQSRQFQMQADADQNKIPDSVQKAEVDNQVKMEKILRDYELKIKELELKEREIALKEKELNLRT